MIKIHKTRLHTILVSILSLAFATACKPSLTGNGISYDKIGGLAGSSDSSFLAGAKNNDGSGSLDVSGILGNANKPLKKNKYKIVGGAGIFKKACEGHIDLSIMADLSLNLDDASLKCIVNIDIKTMLAPIVNSITLMPPEPLVGVAKDTIFFTGGDKMQVSSPGLPVAPNLFNMTKSELRKFSSVKRTSVQSATMGSGEGLVAIESVSVFDKRYNLDDVVEWKIGMTGFEGSRLKGISYIKLAFSRADLNLGYAEAEVTLPDLVPGLMSKVQGFGSNIPIIGGFISSAASLVNKGILKVELVESSDF